MQAMVLEIGVDGTDVTRKISKNKKGGASLGAAKYGGWQQTFAIARNVAGWD